MHLVASFTHDAEQALADRLHLTMLTIDVQGAFDAMLQRRFLQRMMKQGWPRSVCLLVRSFLSNRQVRVRLEKETTPFHPVACGTPQGSPLSPVLYMLYLAEILRQDPTLRFGYADDICLYRVSKSLDTNVQLLAQDMRQIKAYARENRIEFAPEKMEMIHITKQRNTNYHPPCVVDEELIIMPITTAPKKNEQPALRWLGVWFDRKLTFKRHVAERTKKARKVARHIRGLGKTQHGPPPSSLRKAVLTCVLPAALFGTEAWYGGRYKPARQVRGNRPAQVRARVGGLVTMVEQTITLAARGVLPVWRTYPNTALLRDAGLPSAMAALEEAKLRFAFRLKQVDVDHPLVSRLRPRTRQRGRGAHEVMRPITKVQRLGAEFQDFPRPVIRPPHFTAGCRDDPTGLKTKEVAAREFQEWWAALPPEDVTIFSDGSEQWSEGEHQVGYGYVAYQNRRQVLQGFGAINPVSHVFDAEVIGAWSGLLRVLRDPNLKNRRVWMCIDSTSVIWCIRGNASDSSQWAFHKIQDAMQSKDIRVKWSPGHQRIEGNEAADKLANRGSKQPPPRQGPESEPTLSGIKSNFRALRDVARETWWHERGDKLSRWYQQWELGYSVKELPEHQLSRSELTHLLAIRSGHGDFEWYHRKFRHEDAVTICTCGRPKSMDHIVRCRKSQATFRQWPKKPLTPPCDSEDALNYLSFLLGRPKEFLKFLDVTGFFTRICPRF